MNNYTIIMLVASTIIATLAMVIYLYLKKKWKKNNNWESSSFMSVKKFNKLHKNILDTKMIRSNHDKDGPAFETDAKCGFLIASGKSRKMKKLPLLPDNHFKESKYPNLNDIKAYLLPNAHIMVFGGTGSGKTDTVLIPNILLNSLSKERPSGLVFDPKGEIYEKIAPFLLAQGYKVININLSSTAHSDRWSPFQFAVDSGIEYVKYNFILSLLEEGGRNEQEVIAMINTRAADAKTSINETANILVKMSDSESSVWTNTAIDLLSVAGNSLFGFLTNDAFKAIKKWDKYKDVKINNANFEKMKEQILKDEQLTNIIYAYLKQLSTANVSKIINTTSQEEWVRFVWSQGWYDKIGSFNATEDQFKSYLMNISNALSFLGGQDFTDFVSQSDFSYQDLIDKHTMIFINIPASAEKRKAIATLMVQQIWAFLELKSKSYRNGKLPIPFYFYFEELANVPKIQCFLNILTLGRGMNVFGFVVVQSLEQFNARYTERSENASNIVWTNTMAHIYLLGQDNATRDFISKQYGDVELKKEDGSTIIRPLIEPEKLNQIDIGTCLVMEQRQKPIWLKLASYSSYKFFKEWEEKTFLTEHISDQDEKTYAINEAKKVFLTKYTKKTDVIVIPNIIQQFNKLQELQYQEVMFKQLIHDLLDGKNEILSSLKYELITDCLDFYQKHQNNSEDDNEENAIDDVSIETKIMNVFIDKIKEYCNYILHPPKESYGDFINQSFKKASKKNTENLSNEIENKKQILMQQMKGKTKTISELFEMYCSILAEKNENFPFKKERNDKRLPTFQYLIASGFVNLINNQPLIINAIKSVLLKEHFIDKYVFGELKQQKWEQEVANEIFDEQNYLEKNFNNIINEIEKDENQKQPVDEQAKVVLQETYIDVAKKQVIANEFDLYLENKLEIYQRLILRYFENVLINNNKITISELLQTTNIQIGNLPVGIDESYLDSFTFSAKLIETIKKVIRVKEAIITKVKNEKNLKFNDLKEKYRETLVNDMQQDAYFKQKLMEWLESI